ncbi:MAG: proline dehydrogenase [Psychromonas sp.]|jgi:proline dehydrogenase
MISFENTRIAFESKSNKDLRRAYFLFKLISLPWIVKIGKPITEFAIKLHLPIRGLIKSTIFKQFCGGENIVECRTKIDELSNSQIGTILDYSVEGQTKEKDFDLTVEEIIATLKEGNDNEDIPFAVFKISGISRFGLLERINNESTQLTEKEQLENTKLLSRIEKICLKAFESGTPVFIDAEESWVQDGIDRMTYTMMEKYNKEACIIYNTAQMYRHDRLDHINQQTLIAKAKGYFLGIKLVRGAYMEKERDRAIEKKYTSPIQPNKAATDDDFNIALEYLIDNIDYVHFCAGTHNEASNLLLTQLLAKKGLEPDDSRVHFAQLLGMSDHISFNLTYHNYNVAKYVPYGPVNEVLPYLLRRADENTSVAGQTGRELTLISQERKRRRHKK